MLIFDAHLDMAWNALEFNRNLDIAKSLVQSDKVFAMLNVSTALLPATSDFLEQEKVPYIGWGFMPGYCGSKYGFGLNGCLNGTTGKWRGNVNRRLCAVTCRASGGRCAPGRRRRPRSRGRSE